MEEAIRSLSAHGPTDNCDQTSTLAGIPVEKKVNHDLPVLSIPLLCALCLSHTVNRVL